jgi:UDP-N-acetylmuramoyl-tripeptide--D-alanyl-D-alanine ligase
MEIKKLYEIFIGVNQKISTDTRNIIPNSIFFALKGEKFNGNSFAEEAINSGAKYSIIDESCYKTSENIILVGNVLECLQELALFHRKKLSIPIIGITGSNGKTTTKELISKILSKKYNAFATKGNLNNHIGVPLSLLSIMPYHDIAVIEMGANHQNEIDFLCRIALPNYGIITNIGKAHLEGFGGIEGVVKTKTELYNFIQETNGKIFVNADDQLLLKHTDNIQKILYGTQSNAFCKGKIINTFPYLEIEWNCNTIVNFVKTKLYGKYNFQNIMAAICIAKYFNLNDNDVNEALENYIPDNNRSQILEINNNTVILDAYNANPSSMREALINFSNIKAENKICILGDMLELGEQSNEEHKNILNLLQQLSLENTILVGNLFFSIGSKPFIYFKNYEKAGEHLKSKKISQHTILIKGSRGIKLENILSYL